MQGNATAGWDGSDPLPAEPMSVLALWLRDAFAAGRQENPHAVALATVEPGGTPAVRMVLCQEIDAERGSLRFYSHRESPKGRALAACPHAALCFYFGPQGRQARVVGRVALAGDADSDAYFASRPLDARLGAWASRQSEPIASRSALHERVREAAARFGLADRPPGDEEQGGRALPRPPWWGGYLVLAQAVELWISGRARLHDRGRWVRELADPARPGPWRSVRLQP